MPVALTEAPVSTRSRRVSRRVVTWVTLSGRAVSGGAERAVVGHSMISESVGYFTGWIDWQNSAVVGVGCGSCSSQVAAGSVEA